MKSYIAGSLSNRYGLCQNCNFRLCFRCGSLYLSSVLLYKKLQIWSDFLFSNKPMYAVFFFLIKAHDAACLIDFI